MTEARRIQQTYEARLRSCYNEKERIVLLNAYAYELQQFDLTNAVALAEQAYQLAVPLFDKKQMAASLKLMGECHFKIGNCALAAMRLCEALELYSEFGACEDLITCNNLIGVTYKRLHNPTKALEYLSKSQEISAKLNCPKQKANTMNAVSQVYISIKEYEKVFENCRECETIYLETGDKTGLWNTYNTIGTVYYFLDKHQDSLLFFLKALDVFRNPGSPEPRLTAIALNNIGLEYIRLDQPEQALIYLFESLSIREKIYDRWGIAATCLNIAESYLNMQKYDEMMNHLRRGMNISEDMKQNLFMIDGHKLFISYYSIMKKEERVSYHKEKLQQLEEEVLKEEAENKIKNAKLCEELEKAMLLREKK